jgi:hypothetical protein
MRPRLFAQVVLAVAACCAVLPARADEPAAPSRSAGPAIAKSVTVFPIVLNSGAPIPGVSADMPKNMAEVVGLLLERGGMKEIEIADAKFIPAEKADLAKLSEAFGQFVRSQDLKTEYALCGQFIGTPGKGVDEIRLVVVDRKGKIVLSEWRDRKQLARLGEKNVCPMTACCQLVSPLRGLWGLADPNRQDASEGKMARLWAKKSGLPPKSELEAMKSRLAGLKKTLKKSTVAVFPVRVSGKGDPKIAMRLAEMLTKQGLGHAEPANADPKLHIKPNTNQMRIMWDVARAFQDFLRENPPDADYALLADYGIGRTRDGKTSVGGVQIVLCDRKGDWVLVTLRNSHHPDFRKINPQSPDDCNRLVVEAITNELR